MVLFIETSGCPRPFHRYVGSATAPTLFWQAGSPALPKIDLKSVLSKADFGIE
jgi:hypothetical protein